MTSFADMASRSARVVAPATTANLGPGFDCLGLTLDLWNVATFSLAGEGVEVRVAGEGRDVLPHDADNLVVRAFRRLLRRGRRAHAGRPAGRLRGRRAALVGPRLERLGDRERPARRQRAARPAAVGRRHPGPRHRGRRPPRQRRGGARRRPRHRRERRRGPAHRAHRGAAHRGRPGGVADRVLDQGRPAPSCRPTSPSPTPSTTWGAPPSSSRPCAAATSSCSARPWTTGCIRRSASSTCRRAGGHVGGPKGRRRRRRRLGLGPQPHRLSRAGGGGRRRRRRHGRRARARGRALAALHPGHDRPGRLVGARPPAAAAPLPVVDARSRPPRRLRADRAHRRRRAARLGPSEPALFEQAALALASLVCDPAAVEPRETYSVIAEAPGGSPDALLVAWLNELLYRMETDDIVLGRFTIAGLTHRYVAARAAGRAARPAAPRAPPRRQGGHLSRPLAAARRRGLGGDGRPRRLMRGAAPDSRSAAGRRPWRPIPQSSRSRASTSTSGRSPSRATCACRASSLRRPRSSSRPAMKRPCARSRTSPPCRASCGPASPCPTCTGATAFPSAAWPRPTRARGVISPGGVGFDINCGVRLRAHRPAARGGHAAARGAASTSSSARPAGYRRAGRPAPQPRELRDLVEQRRAVAGRARPRDARTTSSTSRRAARIARRRRRSP